MGDVETFQKMLAERLVQQDTSYQNDPVLWVKSNGESLWSKQREILESVRDNRYTAVHSAHDLGKSFLASRAIAWWVSVHPPGSAFVVSTAPSSAQVSAIMWREVSKVHKKSNLVGKITRAGYPQWYIDGELVGYGRKPADYEQSAFQGIHAQHVLIVIDEACGVSQHLFEAVDSLATNENARVLAIGNPDDSTSHFHRVCQQGSGWNVIHLDGLRSPNITYDRVVGEDPEDPNYPLTAALMEADGIPYYTEEVSDEIRPMLVNEKWIEERIARWAGLSQEQAQHTLEQFGQEALNEKIVSVTEGSAIFSSKVRGRFATTSSDGVVPLAWVQRAVERWYDQKDQVAGDFVLGVDVARTGDDETCFAHRYGNYITRLDHHHLEDTTEVTDRAASFLHEPRSKAVIDIIGIGSGVYDLLRRYRREGVITAQPIPFNAAARSPRRDKLGQFKFLNDRAAAWWHFREMLDPALGNQVALPDDEALIEELVAPTYGFNVGGTLKIESKDDIRRRLGRSTDAADAVVQAFWVSGESLKTEAEEYQYGDNDHRGHYQYEDVETDMGSIMGFTGTLDFSADL